MNKTLAKILTSILAVALIVSQFWSCSTAQTISPQQHLTELTKKEIEERGDMILLFKLLTPIMPEEGPHIAGQFLSDAKSDDKTTTHFLGAVVAYIIPQTVQFVWETPLFYLERDRAYASWYALDIHPRGPPAFV